jgi:2-oxoglutarate ferredoxin oxidoreductase subunit alpha
MTDEAVGHMTERVVIPPLEEIEYYPRRKPQLPPGNGYLPYLADPDRIPPMVNAGEGYRTHVTGLTHDERGYPATDSREAQRRLVERLVHKIRNHRDDIIQVQEDQVEGADIVVAAYGISARTAARPVRLAREMGLKVGLLKLQTVWPFPEERIRELASRVKALIVPEINMGQIALEVERCAGGQAQTILVPDAGGGLHDPEQVLEAIVKAANSRS